MLILVEKDYYCNLVEKDYYCNASKLINNGTVTIQKINMTILEQLPAIIRQYSSIENSTVLFT